METLLSKLCRSKNKQNSPRRYINGNQHSQLFIALLEPFCTIFSTLCLFLIRNYSKILKPSFLQIRLTLAIHHGPTLKVPPYVSETTGPPICPNYASSVTKVLSGSVREMLESILDSKLGHRA